MRVGIDGRIFKYKEYRGIANATYNIILQLSKKYREHDFYLISNTDMYIPVALPKNWVKVVKGRIKNGVLWTELELPGVISELGLDVFWGPNFLLPPKVNSCRYYVTVHDLALFRFKNSAAFGTFLTLKILGKKSCRAAEKIFAISNATKRDIVDVYHIKEEKIITCYNGIDYDYYLNIPSERIKNDEVCPNDYFLFLSTIEPRKNPVKVLEAYELYRNRKYGKQKLIFAGADGWKLGSFFEVLSKSAYRQDIIFPGYVSESEKKWLLENATALLYPSLYEGFGLPILEAFVLGTPVITSNVSAMPEIGGKAAIYINNPNDENELSEMMRDISSISDFDFVQLKHEMNRQAKKFKWENCADELASAFLDRSK